MTFADVLFINDNEDDVQMLGNISNGIASNNLWLLIMPYLDSKGIDLVMKENILQIVFTPTFVLFAFVILNFICLVKTDFEKQDQFGYLNFVWKLRPVCILHNDLHD